MPRNAEHPGHGYEHDLEGNEACKQHEGEEECIAAEPPFGEHIAVQGAQKGRN